MPLLNGHRIRERRDELDLTPAQLAERLGISKGYLRNIENGSDQCSGRVMHRMARELALPTSEIQANNDGVPDEPPKQPKNEPKGTPRRQDTERTKGPRRNAEAAA